MIDLSLLRTTIASALDHSDAAPNPGVRGAEADLVLNAVRVSLNDVAPELARALDGVSISRGRDRYVIHPDPALALEEGIRSETNVQRLLDLRLLGSQIVIELPPHRAEADERLDAHDVLGVLADTITGAAVSRLQALALDAARAGGLEAFLAPIAAEAGAPFANGLRTYARDTLASEDVRRRGAEVPLTASAPVDAPALSPGVRMRGAR